MKILLEKLKKVARLLVENRGKLDAGSWPWLPTDKRVNKTQANKFLLGAIMNRQMDADVVWKNARRLTHGALGNPADLWGAIRSKYTPTRWRRLWEREKYHRYVTKMSELIYDAADVLIKQYDGDSRKIWEGRSNSAIKTSLLELPGIGEKIANMIIGALRDTRQIGKQNAEVASDVNVSRVIGRVFCGEKISPQKAAELCRQMYPGQSWQIDNPLYFIGKSHCVAKAPDCENCCLMRECVYYAKNQR